MLALLFFSFFLYLFKGNGCKCHPSDSDSLIQINICKYFLLSLVLCILLAKTFRLFCLVVWAQKNEAFLRYILWWFCTFHAVKRVYKFTYSYLQWNLLFVAPQGGIWLCVPYFCKEISCTVWVKIIRLRGMFKYVLWW